MENKIAFGADNEKNRDEWVIQKLKELSSGNRILDAGAGEQKYRKYCEHLDYVSQDFCQYDGNGEVGLQTGEWNTERIDIVSDIIDIPIEDKSFDAVLCTEVFEHLKNPILAIAEFGRLLKPNGILICTAPFCSLTHFAPYHFATGFNRYWYESALEENGFEIMECTSNGNYFKYLAQEIRRIPTISSRYSHYDLSDSERKLLDESVTLLKKIESKDEGSDELLCFGYHVLAKKL